MWDIDVAADVETDATVDADGVVYFASRDGWLYAVDGADGALTLSWRAGANPPCPCPFSRRITARLCAPCAPVAR